MRAGDRVEARRQMPQAQETALEGQRSEIIARAAEAAERSGRHQDGLRGFLTLYYRHVPIEDLAERDPLDLAGAALSHRQLAAHRPQGTANVRVFTPTVDEFGWTSGHTVVEIVTDDMPFLVDSVMTELSRQERGIHLVVHPQVVVRRDVTGTLLEVLEVSPTDWAKGGYPRDSLVESWIHVETDRETDPGQQDQTRDGVRSVLGDVRVAVEDWPKMKQRAREIADELAAAPPVSLPVEEVGEGRALLGWLADDHFTFLGYREYRLARRNG
ncbi:MAG: NAD-glutamate dehydrogenase, partial [Kineosporiaceae bacterium]